MAIDYAPYKFIEYGHRLSAGKSGRSTHYLFNSDFGGPGDPETLKSDYFVAEGISLGFSLPRGNLIARLMADFFWALRLVSKLRSLGWPPTVVGSNLPVAVGVVLGCLRSLGCIKNLRLWVQDIHYIALGEQVGNSIAARWLVRGFRFIEILVLRRADFLAAISPEHSSLLSSSTHRSVALIPNWATLPTGEGVTCADDSAWAHDHGLESVRFVLYSGTLGVKHSLENFLRLARALLPHDLHLVVISEGHGADRLQQSCAQVSNLHVLPFQSPQGYASALKNADWLFVTLTASAARYSIPSKTLTYLAAGKPILADVPEVSPIATLVEERAMCGIVVQVGDAVDLDRQIAILASLSDLEVDRLGRNGLAYAEDNFSDAEIASRVDRLVTAAPPSLGGSI